MRDFVELGQAPFQEGKAELGDPNYRTNALRECHTFIVAIRNYLGHEPNGAVLDVLPISHDAGTEYQVVCYYDRRRPEAVDYAFRCARQMPQTWAEGGVRPPPRAEGREVAR